MHAEPSQKYSPFKPIDLPDRTCPDDSVRFAPPGRPAAPAAPRAQI